MPSFELDFEVFCAECGAGLCNQSDTRTSRQRGTPQVTVEPCKSCVESKMEKAREAVREEMKSQIDDLEHDLQEQQQLLEEARQP